MWFLVWSTKKGKKKTRVIEVSKARTTWRFGGISNRYTSRKIFGRNILSTWRLSGSHDAQSLVLATGTEPPVCMVTEPWICRFRLSTPDCEHRVNRSDVTCSIYCGHISLGMYDSLKSLQTTTSFQPCRPLSLAYFLAFFVFHTKNHATFFHSDKLDFKT